MHGFRRSSIPAVLFVVTLAQWPAAAQFQGLATTGNGSVLYFSSPIRQKGTDQTFHSKIFRWNASGGIRVFAEVPSEGQSDGCVTNSFYQLQAPQVSDDGTAVAYTASRAELRVGYGIPRRIHDSLGWVLTAAEPAGQPVTRLAPASLPRAGNYTASLRASGVGQRKGKKHAGEFESDSDRGERFRGISQTVSGVPPEPGQGIGRPTDSEATIEILPRGLPRRNPQSSSGALAGLRQSPRYSFSPSGE